MANSTEIAAASNFSGVTETSYYTLINGATQMSNFTLIKGVDDEASWIAFWFSVVLCLIAGVISILGNGLVLYVSIMKKDIGRFRYINFVAKNLALSDFLFGLIGTPATILFWYWGKNHIWIVHNLF